MTIKSPILAQRINKIGEVLTYDTQKARREFEHWYFESFNRSVLELAIWQHCQLNADYYDRLFTNELSNDSPVIDTVKIDAIRREWKNSELYTLFGHEGHGINSLRIVYCYFHNNIRVYLRIAYGGVYQDNDQQIKVIQLLIESCDKLVQSAIKYQEPLEFFSPGSEPGCLQYGSDHRIDLIIENMNEQAKQINCLIEQATKRPILKIVK